MYRQSLYWLMEGNKDVELLTLMDYFAKFEITIDYNFDEDEEDFVETLSIGHINEDEDDFSSIKEDAEDKTADYIYDYIEEEENKGKNGQLLCKLFDNKDVDEAEGVSMFKKYKDGIDDDDERDRMFQNLYTNIFDAEYEKDVVETAVRKYISVHKEGGDLNCLVNGIPLFVIEQIIKAIIYMNLDEEGEVHFDMDGHMDLIINVE